MTLRFFSTPDLTSWNMHFAKMATIFENPFQQQIIANSTLPCGILSDSSFAEVALSW